ncbi:MAG: GNAT family N-acetyltransferase [Ginsengibacter sp.]
MITWQCKPFSELNVAQLYKILQLRSQVFVVEQQCAYQDCDGKDVESFHLIGWRHDELIAYCRIIPKGISYTDAVSIGRVVTAPFARRKNIGKLLMTKALEEVQNLFGDVTLKISAQVYLRYFYESFAFISKGEIYLEDGIEHIAMEK